MQLKYNQEAKVGVFCRLSIDDGYMQESISIQNQKAIIIDYCNKKEYKIVDYYIDDGYSGTNFNRPQFKEMLDDIEKSKINTIIVKDLSRFGRDYIKSGYYLESYFPEHNIRFIAISDNYDSFYNDDYYIPFKNIINEMYAKDISKKNTFHIRKSNENWYF